ncbi:MAG: NADH-quinone oxidoreductase subunit L [Kofleriaceae bacterium]
MNLLDAWPPGAAGAALAIPLTWAVTALATPRQLGRAGVVAAALAVAVCLGQALAPGAAASGVKLDVVACAMLALVATLGAIVARFATTYLQGDPGLARHLRWLGLTLAAVTTLVVADNLAVMAVAWTATSLALHQLLTFHRDRPAALVAAHKKFLVSRLADASLLGCLALVHREVGSFDLDQIAAWAGTHPGLTPAMHAAAVLLVVAVALRAAQLPFHGWLTQVMEAPTPVSALLHAGIVNIGGYVLIRVAPWVGAADIARLLLVGVGLASVVVAALVMTTRVSAKVTLAWSTCAQMGFLLVQCGLGLWHLALLHLVAHSLYKAHAFLRAGSTVAGWRQRSVTQRAPARRGRSVALVVGVGAVVGAVAACAVVDAAATEALAIAVMAALVSLSMVPLLDHGDASARSAVVAGARASVVALLYVGAHAAAARLVPAPAAAPHLLAWALVGAAFVGLFAVKATLLAQPRGRLAQALYPWLAAGCYLDARFTRLLFRWWPPRLPRPRAPVSPFAVTAEARS